MRKPTRRRILLAIGAVTALGVATAAHMMADAPPDGSYALFAVNDLGMHCMQDDYSEFCILPPYNNVHAQLIRRGDLPVIVQDGVTVRYTMPAQQRVSDQTNFWVFAPALFGVNLPAGVGLAGNRTWGTMQPSGDGIYVATGIPALSSNDEGRIDPYPLALVSAQGALGTAYAPPVVPVSSEMSCSFCHGAEGGSVASSFLTSHDTMHGTHLMDQRPVLCASCHADNALGAPGVPGVSNLSSAMHLSHASRVGVLGLDNSCYACHPGVRSECQRDLHSAQGITCVQCHGDMVAVGAPARTPWVDQPRCGSCHHDEDKEFEQPGTLFKDSIGHGGVRCTTCHGPPHAMVQATNELDNYQYVRMTGSSHVVEKCTTCHLTEPSPDFFHRVNK